MDKNISSIFQYYTFGFWYDSNYKYVDEIMVDIINVEYIVMIRTFVANNMIL